MPTQAEIEIEIEVVRVEEVETKVRWAQLCSTKM
jgi:hypothetical protein